MNRTPAMPGGGSDYPAVGSGTIWLNLGRGGSGGVPPSAPEPGKTDSVKPVDPDSGAGDLKQYRERVGQSIETDLVGSTEGRVWGTDVYTDDSSPAAAAVHAGVLRDGESGHVRITILPGQDSYQGSEHNGVSTQSWQAWGGSFRVERAGKAAEDRPK